MILETTLTSYSITYRCVQNYRSNYVTITCKSENERISLLIVFIEESKEDDPPPYARIDSLPRGSSRVVVYYPLSMLQSIHHTLQTEKPIRLYANNNNDYTQVVFGTSQEPSGEEEG